jgi:hypothetical protein
MNRILAAAAIVLAIVLASLASIDKERTFVASCTVTVQDANGHPVKRIRISENWDAYSYDLSGGEDTWTDENGRASFPRRSGKHSLLFWQFRPVLTHLDYGIHASSVVDAFIRISDPGRQNTEAFSCTDHECNSHPLVLGFQVAQSGAR